MPPRGTGSRWASSALPVVLDKGKFDAGSFANGLAEGMLNRLVRVQLSKGVKDKGKMHYQLRIDNASPLVLNGLAALGMSSPPDDVPKILSGICLSPRKSMTVSASEGVVKSLGLKRGTTPVALDRECARSRRGKRLAD